MSCTFPSGAAPQQITADVHLKAGWNREILTEASSGSPVSMGNISVTTGPLLDAGKWIAR